MRFLYALYHLAGWCALGLALPLVALRALGDRRFRVGWGERLARWGEVPRHGVWVHGASVGEMRAAAPLVADLNRRRVQLLLTTTSPAGREAARTLVRDPSAVRLLPLDIPWLLRRAVRRTQPRALVLVETELWPALLWECRRAGVPVLVVNGRISDRAFPRYRRARALLRPLLQSLYQVQAQSAQDVDRFRALGVAAAGVIVGGNLKYDVPAVEPGAEVPTALRRTHADGWRVVVAGSTHPGEEAAVVQAVASLTARGVRVGLVLAPRHPERIAEAVAEVRGVGGRVRLWSQLEPPLEQGVLQAFREGRVLVIDGLGILGGAYGGADCAFVGGSLAPVGGHNLLEPLAWGIPVLFGPHLQNAREIRDEVLVRGLGFEVTGPEELGEALHRCLSDAALRRRVADEAGRLFAQNRGAVRRAVEALELMGALDRED